MRIIDLLNQCDKAYDASTVVAGPDGRDGAMVTSFPTGEVVLAFRGTLVEETVRSVLDWMNDFASVLIKVDGFPGRVHEGFWRSLNSLWDGVMASLEAGGYKDGDLPWKKNLYITGHSKGGALAILAGCKLAALKPVVVTFASPMTGDLNFAVGYPQEIALTRYEGKDDLVPWLPPFGYRPAGGLIGQTKEEWKARHSHAHSLIADLLDPFTQQTTWKKVHQAHSLATGYIPWIQDYEIRAAA